MVMSESERKTTPEYCLDRIRDLASSGQVVYGSRRVETADQLYLKLHLNRNMIIVTLDSFHRNR